MTFHCNCFPSIYQTTFMLLSYMYGIQLFLTEGESALKLDEKSLTLLSFRLHGCQHLRERSLIGLKVTK